MNAPIGHNNPPPETAIDRAKPVFHELGEWLKANPAIMTEDESRDAADLLNRAKQAFSGMERERDGRVRPLNEEVKSINSEYRHPVWDKLTDRLSSELTRYAKAEERKRYEAEEAARREAEEAREAARRATEAAAEAREAVEAGVCDVDLAAAIQDEHSTSQTALRAMWNARRTEGQTKVRIKGSSGRAISLRDHEILTVTDWQAAISEMGLTREIADAIIKSARAYRKLTDALPTGVEAENVRSL